MRQAQRPKFASWWLILSAGVFGLTGAGPLAAATGAEPQIGAILGLYAALHGAVTALEVVAVATRRVPWLGSAAAAVGALLAWLLVGMMDALGPSFGRLEPEALAVVRLAAALGLSLAALTYLASAPRRANPT